jgi:CO/xanthine dehydrogenase Mo-binding subunit
VKKVVDVGSGVAVIATGFWPAKRARDLLKIDWDTGDGEAKGAPLSSGALREQYRALALKPGLVAREDGDPGAILKASKNVLTADYELPFLAHAPMEPLNCVVDLRADAMDIWVGTQFQTVDHGAACKVAGLSGDKVKLHTTFLGGGFGRRANPVADYIVEAVKIAKVGRRAAQADLDARGRHARGLLPADVAQPRVRGARRSEHHRLVAHDRGPVVHHRHGRSNRSSSRTASTARRSRARPTRRTRSRT